MPSKKLAKNASMLVVVHNVEKPGLSDDAPGNIVHVAGRQFRFFTDWWAGFSEPMPPVFGEPLVVVRVPSGTAPSVGAAVLRKLADIIDKNRRRIIRGETPEVD
jgi:hypothetical protein